MQRTHHSAGLLRAVGALKGRHLLCLLFSITPLACAHPAEEALEGRWEGISVENFELESAAAASGWARGTSFEFRGNRLKVQVPATEPRTGIYRLTAIDERRVSLSVLDAHGEESELELIFDDTRSLRWVMDEGRTVVLKRRE